MAMTITNKPDYGRREPISKIMVGGIQLDKVMRQMRRATWKKGSQKKTFVCGNDKLELVTGITKVTDEFKNINYDTYCSLYLNDKCLLHKEDYKTNKNNALNYLKGYFYNKTLEEETK